MPAHECNRYHALPLALPLGLCFCRWMWCCFVLYKVGTIIMTVAINALPVEPMHFYALEVLASCSTRRVRLHFVLCKVSSIIMTVVIDGVLAMGWLVAKIANQPVKKDYYQIALLGVHDLWL